MIVTASIAVTVLPRVGINDTLTLHVPREVARTAEPLNVQCLWPFTMLRRSVPCDLRGT